MSSLSSALRNASWFAGSLLLTGLLSSLSGCNTEAYCFSGSDCAGATAAAAGSAGTAGTAGSGGSSGTAGISGSGGTAGSAGFNGSSGSAGTQTCTPTVDPLEICDGLDNDCDGQSDNVTDAGELSKVTSCGTCSTNCVAQVLGSITPTCTPPATAGTPGTCGYTTCSDGYADNDGDATNGCEYSCPIFPTTAETCDGLDNNCDGKIDETIDFCSVDTCSICSNQCALAHATPACSKIDAGGASCKDNAQCTIGQCEAGWVDRNNNPVDGCEFECTITNGGVEICDGIDNDCDGLIDGEDDLSGDTNIFANGQPIVCQGAAVGECALPSHAGVFGCVNSQVVCTGPNVLMPDQNPELCNNLDDDCDGFVDDNPQGQGDSCGTSNIFPCSYGTKQCQSGTLNCVGNVEPGVEVCNGVDDDCDGQIDKTAGAAPSDSVGTCDVPIAPPPGATSPCMAGSKACVGGTVKCQGSVLPATNVDGCGIDANCDGQLTGQPDTTSDVHNCGGCGIDCTAGTVHANYACNNNVCQFTACQTGYYDLDNDGSCEYQCNYVSATEACNGADDNCNGQIDEGITPLSPAQVCGVSPAATSAECTSQVTVACQNGGWKCTFPANVCSTIVAGKPSCSATPEVCDTLDNNCNGVKNETSPLYGKTCASDDSAPGTQGVCRTTGTYVCDPATSTTATKCSAVKANCASLPGGCTELCDGLDNDCDGLVDESNINKGTNATNFVKPTVTKIGASLWMSSYESSRPSATNVTAGTGNGYFCTAYTAGNADPYCKAAAGSLPSAPANTPLQKTPACSVPSKIPWFNVTPIEVEQTCKASGGRACTTAEYTTGCQATSSCTYGYAPRGATCTSSYTASKFCNIGPSWDFNMVTTGDQDGLLPTASGSLQNCYSDWSNLQGNTAATNKIFDITGNLREITRVTTGSVYNLMGGANSSAESGSTCTFNFYSVNQNFQFYDTGFRCCFDTDPTL